MEWTEVIYIKILPQGSVNWNPLSYSAKGIGSSGNFEESNIGPQYLWHFTNLIKKARNDKYVGDLSKKQVLQSMEDNSTKIQGPVLMKFLTTNDLVNTRLSATE